MELIMLVWWLLVRTIRLLGFVVVNPGGHESICGIALEQSPSFPGRQWNSTKRAGTMETKHIVRMFPMEAAAAGTVNAKMVDATLAFVFLQRSLMVVLAILTEIVRLFGAASQKSQSLLVLNVAKEVMLSLWTSIGNLLM